jgi:hypothetical protein
MSSEKCSCTKLAAGFGLLAVRQGGAIEVLPELLANEPAARARAEVYHALLPGAQIHLVELFFENMKAIEPAGTMPAPVLDARENSPWQEPRKVEE